MFLAAKLIFRPISPPRRILRPAITTGIDSNGNGKGKDEGWRIKQLIDVLIIQLLLILILLLRQFATAVASTADGKE